MTRRRHLSAVTLALLFGACAAEPAAPPPQTLSSADRGTIVAAATTLIGKVPFATLGTVGEDGAPQSRIVDPFPLEDNFTVWIATNGASRKVREIAREPRVSLTYFDQSSPGYVTLVGTADIVRDPAEKAKRWKESWVGFYKDRNRGDDYTLIRLTPSRLEISSQSQGMNNDPVTWRAVTLQLR